ncbi:MAG: nickel/cobalt transporter [Dehalococcoidia bacterium]
MSRVARFGLVALLLAVLGATALGPATATHAHPLGNFTINHYSRLELYRDRVRIHYVVDFAEIPAFQLTQDLDTNLDEEASPEELEAYVTTQRAVWAANLALTVDGERLPLDPIEQAAQVLPGQAGLTTIRIVVVYDAMTEAADQAVQVSFQDGNFSGRAGWKEVVVLPSQGAKATVLPALLVDRSDALRNYPLDPLADTPDVRSATFSWQPGTGDDAPFVAGAQRAEGRNTGGGFAGLFADALDGNQSLGFILLSLLIAFAFGAQHALGPGHGKTMVGAYLVGSKGTPKQAVFLGMTVTATHTSTVYLLGAVTLVAASWLTPDRVYLWMGVASGALVVVFGAVLLAARLLNLNKAERASDTHRHGIFGKAHSHAPAETSHHAHDTSERDHGHERDHAHDTSEPDHGHEHPHGHAPADDHAHNAHGDHADEPASKVTARNILSLGILGGLLPCPSAVVVMVAAIAQGEVALGMLLIVAFSLGLAGVLTALGLSLVYGKRLPAGRITRQPLFQKAMTYMPVISAFVVMAAGFGITYQALQQPGF